MYYDKFHENRRTRAFSYDINSSYSNGMLQDMPDTSKPPRINDVIKNNNELGFYMNDNELICTEEIGKKCRFIFPKVESIEDLMDENTIYCNTDSIVSLVPRDDLEIGDDIGQFKEEDKGKMFAYKGFEYQWDLQAPTYRSVAKKWFPKGWDILKDPIPTQGNLVKFNPELCMLEEVSYEETRKV